jgi:hypothetical protein
MEQRRRDQPLLEALLEAGLEVKTVEIRRGKKVVTVEKRKPKARKKPGDPVLSATKIPRSSGF